MGRKEIYKDADGQYRWRIVARNKKIIANCGEGYKRKVDCIRALHRVVVDAFDWNEVDLC